MTLRRSADANTAVLEITQTSCATTSKNYRTTSTRARAGLAGDEAARQYLARELGKLGLLPGAADGSWEQPFELIGVTADQPEEWSFRKDDDELTLKQWDEFIVSSGVQAQRAEVSDAEVVFVGYGIQAPEYEWNDYKNYDVTGKVVLVMNNDPDWDEDLFAGERRLWYGRWLYKYQTAAEQGAIGAIIIHTRRRPDTRSRLCRRPGPASSSNCPPEMKRDSRRRLGYGRLSPSHGRNGRAGSGSIARSGRQPGF